MKLTTYIYKLGQLLVFASLFLPTIILDEYIFPFIAPRNFIFRILMLLGVGVLVFLWANAPELRPKKRWINIAVASVIVAKLLSGIFGVHWLNSFWSNYERMEGIVGWVFFGVFYYLVITVFRTRKDWIWLFRVSLLPALYISLYGISQWFGLFGVIESRQTRIESRLGNAAYLGAYMLLHIGIAAYVLIKEKAAWVRYSAIACIILFHVTLFLTATRGAFLGWGVGVFVAALLYLYFGSNKKIKLATAVGIVTLVVGLVGVRAGGSTDFVRNIEPLKRIATVSFADATVKSRLVVWDIAWQGFLARPIFGWGQDNFNYVFNAYFDESAREQWVDRAHNNLLDQLSMGGIVTFVSYLALLVYPFAVFWRLRRNAAIEAIALLALWVAYIVQNQFVFDSINTYLLFFVLLAYAHSLHRNAVVQDDADQGQYEAIKQFVPTQRLSMPVNTVMLVALCIGVIVGNFAINTKAHAANRMFIKSLVTLGSNPQEAFDLTQSAVELDSYGNKEIAMQGLTLLSGVMNNPGATDEFKVQVLLYLIETLEASLEREPDEVRVMLTLEQLYAIANRIDPTYMEKAKQLLERAREIGPGRASVYYPLAQIALNTNDAEQAASLLRTSIELNPRGQEGYTNLMNVLLVQGKIDEAVRIANDFVELRGDALGENAQHVLLVAQVYMQAEKWEDAVPYLEALVKSDIRNVGYLQLLGQAYYSLGAIELVIQIDEMIEEIEGEGTDSFILEKLDESTQSEVGDTN